MANSPGREASRAIFHSPLYETPHAVYNRYMQLGASATFMDPRAVISHFHLRQGDTVADFGAGTGHYMKTLSQAVGSQGKVYACEIQKRLLTELTERIQKERLANVYPVWCDLEAHGGTKLKEDLLDAGLLMNTLFQIEDKVSALTEIRRVLRKGGKLLIVDWKDSFGGIGPQPGHVMKEAETRKLLEAHGFVFERDFPAADHHYGLAFKKQ